MLALSGCDKKTSDDLKQKAEDASKASTSRAPMAAPLPTSRRMVPKTRPAARRLKAAREREPAAPTQTVLAFRM